MERHLHVSEIAQVEIITFCVTVQHCIKSALILLSQNKNFNLSQYTVFHMFLEKTCGKKANISLILPSIWWMMAPFKTCLLASGERWTTFILASCCYSWRTTKRKWFYSVCVCSQSNSHLDPPLSFAQKWPSEPLSSSPGPWTEPPTSVVVGESGCGNCSTGLWRHCTPEAARFQRGWVSMSWSKTRDRKKRPDLSLPHPQARQPSQPENH